MPKRKEFTINRYNEIKQILKDNKIESYELENYILFKDTRYLRHTQKVSISDTEILDMVNSNNTRTKFEELLDIAKTNIKEK
jgi:hypothetical protein